MKSFLEGRQSVKSQNPSIAPQGPGFQPLVFKASAGASNGPHIVCGNGNDSEPKVELIRRDGMIERIIITCGCCKRIELECEY